MDADHWLKLIDEELEALKENNTWSITLFPVGRKAIGTKWVFKVKRIPNGEISRFKSRLCAKG